MTAIVEAVVALAVVLLVLLQWWLAYRRRDPFLARGKNLRGLGKVYGFTFPWWWTDTRIRKHLRACHEARTKVIIERGR